MLAALLSENGGKLLRQNIPLKQRKAIANKMCKALKLDIKMLTKEMQEVLVDDLVTAFLNRLDILKHVNENEPKHDLMIRCSGDVLELSQTRQGQS